MEGRIIISLLCSQFSYPPRERWVPDGGAYNEARLVPEAYKRMLRLHTHLARGGLLMLQPSPALSDYPRNRST
jgi:hypothetical protein